MYLYSKQILFWLILSPLFSVVNEFVMQLFFAIGVFISFTLWNP